MRAKFIILAIAMITVTTIRSEGQVSKILRNRTQKAESADTTKKGSEVDRVVTKGLLNLKDKLLGSERDTIDTGEKNEVSPQGGDTETGRAGESTEEIKSQQGRNAFSGLFGGGTELKHKESYEFSSRIVMKMEAYNEEEGRTDQFEYVSFMNPSNGDMAIQIKPVGASKAETGMDEMVMIFDLSNKCSLILTSMGSQKTAIVSPYLETDESESEMIESYEEVDDIDYKKTGRTKTILGYRCDEYVVQDNETTINMWVTSELNFNMNRKRMEKAGIPVYYDGPFEGGMVMEMEGYEGDNNKMKMEVIDIETKSTKAISLQGYNIMNMDTDSFNR